MSNLPRRRGLLASVGLDSEHRPALVDFAQALTPHCLIAGTTGSGKTNAARLVVYNLASQNDPDNVNFVLIDTRKRGNAWKDFDSIPHLANPVITSDETALRALSWTVAEIDRRAESGRTKPALFIGVDESQDLLDREEFVRLISDIAATGREFGIHLLAAMQNPTAKQLGDASIKRNLTTRLVGRVDSATAAVVATGQSESGAELLTGAGDMLLVQPMGIKRLTAALLTEKDTARLPQAESVGALDLSQFEDVDHVLAQADNAKSAGDFDALETVISLLAAHYGKGRPWLKDALEAEGRNKPGSSRARRLLAWGKEVHDLLRQYHHILALTD